MLRELLKISKEAYSTTSLGNICRCSVTLTVKYLLVFTWNLMFFTSCPLPCLRAPMKRAWLHPLYTLPSSYLLMRISLSIILSWPVPALIAFHDRRVAPAPWSSLWPSAELFPLCQCLILGSPDLDTVLQVCPHQHCVGKVISLNVRNTTPNVVQAAGSLLCVW